MSEPTEDVYANNEEDWFPGARQRSRPGQGPEEPIYDTTVDVNGRRVTDKPANRAMLASSRRQAEHDARVQAQRDADQRAIKSRQRQRSTASVAHSKAHSSSSSWFSLLLLFLFLPLLSSFLTHSYTFNLSPYIVPPLRKFWAETTFNPWREEMMVLTPLQLAMYDGSDPALPVYLAIDGVVYDVTANRRVYGVGGSYNMMAGRDASRAFTTGCFQTHLTHDTRGLSEEELASLDHWKAFFAKHDQYRKVGTVLNPPISPSTPIPPPCRETQSQSDSSTSTSGTEAQAEGDKHAPGERAAKQGKDVPEPVHVHT